MTAKKKPAIKKTSTISSKKTKMPTAKPVTKKATNSKKTTATKSKSASRAKSPITTFYQKRKKNRRNNIRKVNQLQR